MSDTAEQVADRFWPVPAGYGWVCFELKRQCVPMAKEEKRPLVSSWRGIRSS